MGGQREARAPPFLFRTFSITLLIFLALDQFLTNFLKILFWNLIQIKEMVKS